MNLRLFKGLTMSFVFLIIGCDDNTQIIEPENNDTDTGKADQGTSAPDHVTEACPDIGIENGSLNTRYNKKTISLENSDKTYILHTNWWYQWDGQTVAYDGLSFTVSNPKNLDVGSVGAPLGYPSLYIGSYSGNASKGSNLPKKVTDIQTIPTSFHTNAGELGYSNKNAAYDVWFTAGETPLPMDQYDPGAGGAYLMVWLYKPTDRQPRGSISEASHEIEGVEGKWNVWVDPSNPVCISYVATENFDGLDFDLNAFIKDSITNEYGITEEMYLSIIFAGFEIWGGGDGFRVERFCADVQ